MRKNGNTAAFGIKKFGYISDFKSSVAQFNHLLQGTGQSVTSTEIDSIVDGVTPVNLNSFGCDNHYSKPVSDEFAAYRMVRTGRKTASGDEIVGLFVRNKNTNPMRA